jgi:hypothetical protein
VKASLDDVGLHNGSAQLTRVEFMKPNDPRGFNVGLVDKGYKNNEIHPDENPGFEFFVRVAGIGQ